MVITEDTDRIYLYGDVKVALEGRGFGSGVSLNNEKLLEEKQHISWEASRSHTEACTSVSSSVWETDEGSCGEIYIQLSSVYSVASL